MNSPQREILRFAQNDKDTIDRAWHKLNSYEKSNIEWGRSEMRWSLLTISSCFASLCIFGCGLIQFRDARTEDEHTAEAFLNAGNEYYSRASEESLSAEERVDLYRHSLDNYRKVLQTPGIEEKTKAKVTVYVRQIEGLLARDVYDAGDALVRFDMDTATKKANAPKAIPYFKEVIDSFPDTDYADLSYVQLGLCYEYLEEWQEAEKAYEALIEKYTDENGNPIQPFSKNVKQALEFARDRLSKIGHRKLIAVNTLRMPDISIEYQASSIQA